jgi:hypothetical protein
MRTQETKKAGLRFASLIIFLAIVVTLVHQYKFGVDNQIEQIPLILRQLDPSYLKNDLVVNAGSGYTPRTYYVLLMASLTKVVGLESGYLLMTWLANLATLAVTARLSWEIFGSRRALVLSMAMVGGFESINIGGAAELVGGVLTPQLLSTGIALMGVCKFYKGKIDAGVMLCVLAGLIHPQLGLVTGGAALIAAGNFRKNIWWGLLLVSVGLFIWLPVIWSGSGYVQPLEYFMRDYVRWRAPHHLLPSSWDGQQYLEFGLFVLTVMVVSIGRRLNGYWIRLVGVLLVLFLGGWIFVEYVPLRWVILIQPWRMVYLIKWVGLVIGGGLVASSSKWLLMVPVFAGRADVREWWLWAVIVVCGLVWQSRQMWCGVVGVTVCILMWSGFWPQFRLSQLKGGGYEIGRYLERSFPGEVVMVPADMGYLRYIGKVAIVADWKVDPLDDATRVEWRNRIVDMYGESVADFASHYNQLSDVEIKNLSEKYHFGLAVVFANKTTDFPVVFVNNTYKLISVR